MFFEYSNIRYKIWFRHWIDNTKTNTGGITTCYIGTRGDNPNRSVTPVYEATAYCHDNDHFVKETGRKLSLERACKQANDKLFTRAVFNCYLNRKTKETT